MSISNLISHPQYPLLPTERRIGVQTLPQNITASIIQLATTTNDDDDDDDDQVIDLLTSPRWRLEPPTLAIKRLHELTLVCRTWRKVVLHTPAMWARIVIFLDNDPASSLDWVELCLQRSSRLPLSVYLCTRVASGHAVDACPERETVDVLLSAVSREFYRVVVLSIETYHTTSLPDIVNLLKRHSLPRLKTLVLHGASDACLNPNPLNPYPTCTPQRGPAQISEETCSTLPSLQHLVIDGRNLLKMLSTLPNHIHIPLANLSTLIISNLTPTTPNHTDERVSLLFTALLPSLTKLHTLAFEKFQITQSPTLQIPRTLLGMSIAYLGMKGMESTAVRYVFGCITDPDEVVLVRCGFDGDPVSVPRWCRLVTFFGMPGSWVEY